MWKKIVFNIKTCFFGKRTRRWFSLPKHRNLRFNTQHRLDLLNSTLKLDRLDMKNLPCLIYSAQWYYEFHWVSMGDKTVQPVNMEHDKKERYLCWQFLSPEKPTMTFSEIILQEWIVIKKLWIETGLKLEALPSKNMYIRIAKALVMMYTVYRHYVCRISTYRYTQKPFLG